MSRREGNDGCCYRNLRAAKARECPSAIRSAILSPWAASQQRQGFEGHGKAMVPE